MPIRHTVIAALLALIAALSFGVYYYHDAYSKADHDLSQAKETIIDMQTRQRDVAALDEKYTRELADAKKTISDLHRDVDAGRKRLRVAATCKPTAFAPGLVNAGTCELDTNSRRTYFRLREQLITTENQVRGLQEYVKGQCLK
ncbi:lysis protein [Pectobacterium parmentieri]|uniref:lysis protein n=1 Tax=Pectobacterium parmentieri TaxID=1905730 RepID=UPI000F8DBABA|nr:lysis protein [Pectobacterium parmentieri]AZS56779.1 lysis protein [Pectobacterium parmentieri]MBI0431682.1 lysis protein [Pectobacterium parmentieri]